jgi:hypothetical protein
MKYVIPAQDVENSDIIGAKRFVNYWNFGLWKGQLATLQNEDNVRWVLGTVLWDCHNCIQSHNYE